MSLAVLEPNKPIGDTELDFFEMRSSLRLPPSYRQFLRTYNGGQPVPRAFPITGLEGNPFGTIQAFFGLGAAISTEDLDGVLKDLGGRVPSGVLPVACTDSDDFVCLDLREGKEQVVFWDRRHFWGSDLWAESDLYPVAASFDEFLNRLHDES